MRALISARPSRPPSLAALLDQQVDELDALLNEVRLGIRSTRRFDELEEKAGAIADALRAAFRGAR